MGADLYIRSLSDQSDKEWRPVFDEAVKRRDAARSAGDEEAVDKIQREVESAYGKMFGHGYFRDSYNGTSLFWVLGLSWWEDVVPMCTDGSLPPDKAKQLLLMVENRSIPPITEAYCKKHHLALGDKDTLENWTAFYERKRGNFIMFLKTAIELNERVDCSL